MNGCLSKLPSAWCALIQRIAQKCGKCVVVFTMASVSRSFSQEVRDWSSEAWRGWGFLPDNSCLDRFESCEGNQPSRTDTCWRRLVTKPGGLGADSFTVFWCDRVRSICPVGASRLLQIVTRAFVRWLTVRHSWWYLSRSVLIHSSSRNSIPGAKIWRPEIRQRCSQLCLTATDDHRTPASPVATKRTECLDSSRMRWKAAKLLATVQLNRHAHFTHCLSKWKLACVINCKEATFCFHHRTRFVSWRCWNNSKALHVMQYPSSTAHWCSFVDKWPRRGCNTQHRGASKDVIKVGALKIPNRCLTLQGACYLLHALHGRTQSADKCAGVGTLRPVQGCSEGSHLS